MYFLKKFFFVGSDIMISGGNDNFEFDDVIKNNKSFSSKNTSKKMIETSSQCKRMFNINYNNNNTLVCPTMYYRFIRRGEICKILFLLIDAHLKIIILL